MALVVVSGHLKGPNGVAIAGTVSFSLVNYGDNLPRVLGSNAIVPLLVNVNADATGFYSVSLQGNDTIDPGGTNTPPTTYYSVTFQATNAPTISLPFQFTGSGTSNLDSQAPLVVVPAPNPPSGSALVNVALKPLASDSIQYVSPNGSDSNDGFSMGTSKLTLTAAQNVLFNAGTGGMLYVMGGTYNLSSTFNLRSNTYLYCESSVVITRPNSTFLSLGLISLAGADHATIDNATIDGNRAGNVDGENQVLVQLSGSTNAVIKNCRIQNGTNVGVYTGTGTTPTIVGNQFSNFWGSGLELGFTGATVATKAIVKNNIFTQANLTGASSDGNVISSNTITGYAQASNVTTAGTAVTWTSGTTFTNVKPGMYLVLSPGTEYLISAVGSSTSLTLSSGAGSNTNVLSYIGTADLLNIADSSNNTISENVVSTGMGYGIVVLQDGVGASEPSLHNVITSNTVSNTGGDGIAINSTASSPIVGGTVVVGNAISNAGKGGTAKGVNRNGIILNGAGTHYTVISGNNIYDDQGGSATTLFGVSFVAGVPADQVMGPNAITAMVSGQYNGGAAGILGVPVVLNVVAPTVAAAQVGLGSTTATSATAGSNGAVPAQVLGYLIANVAGTAVKIPYYNT